MKQRIRFYIIFSLICMISLSFIMSGCIPKDKLSPLAPETGDNGTEPELGGGTPVAGLLLWNKLGSDLEVQNSEVGIDLNIKGTPTYASCKFDNGIYFPSNETHNIDCDSSIVPLDKGCIEFWWKPTFNWDNVSPTNWSAFINISIHSPLKPATNTTILMFQYNPASSLFGFYYYWVDSGDNYIMKFITVPPLSFNANDIIHLAIAWDKDNNIEGQYSLAIYQNGTNIGGSTDTIAPQASWAGDLDIVGNGVSEFGGWDGCKGPMDNIKIWNYPKTNFSDRFTE